MKSRTLLFCSKLKFALAVSALAFALPSMATPIPVGITTASDLIFNFNFLPLSPPYTSVDVTLTLAGWGAGESITVDAFTGLNGSGTLGDTETSGGPGLSINFSGLNFISSGFGDGVFSVGIRLNTGAADVTAGGSALNSAGAPVTATVTVGTAVTSVPEPATLALVGLGLAGLGFARRRKPQ